VRTTTPALYIYQSGRQACRQDTPEGRWLYRVRTISMVWRQGRRCCLEAWAPGCPGALREADATFEHENGRTSGKRDDRPELPDGTWINGAAHGICNSWKSSRRIPYNRCV
jgi:hypothetical protein